MPEGVNLGIHILGTQKDLEAAIRILYHNGTSVRQGLWSRAKERDPLYPD
jgi:hypothetical protein